MRSLINPAKYINKFPVFGYAFIARFSSEEKRLLIGVGLGSADLGFIEMLNDRGINVVQHRKALRERLEGKQENIIKLSPREITGIAKDIVRNSEQTGIIFPGSSNTIVKHFWSRDAGIPAGYLDFKSKVAQRNSFFKMAMTFYSLMEGYPTIFSCDYAHYPVIALGGEITKTPDSGSVIHNHEMYHDILVRKNNWLHNAARRITPNRNEDGDIIIKNTLSTHPLIPKKLPDGALVLAYAPDGSPGIYSFSANTVAILDHIEAGPPIKEKVYNGYTIKERAEDIDCRESLALWDVILRKFLEEAEKENSRHPVPEKRFSPRIAEKLEKSSWEEVAAQSFSARGR